MGGRKRVQNREVVYLAEDIAARLREFVKARPHIGSKSRVIEIALQCYLDEAAKYGIDDRWYPMAAEASSPYRTKVRGHPRKKAG